MFRVASSIELRARPAFRARFIWMAADSDNTRTRPYRTIGEAVRLCFIVPVQVKSPAREWLAYLCRRELSMSTRLQEGFRAGALTAFRSAHPLPSRPLPKPPRPTELSDCAEAEKPAKSRLWSRNAAAGCSRAVASGVRFWIEVLDGTVQALYLASRYFRGRAGDVV